jgi:hypothetical protein
MQSAKGCLNRNRSNDCQSKAYSSVDKNFQPRKRMVLNGPEPLVMVLFVGRLAASHNNKRRPDALAVWPELSLEKVPKSLTYTKSEHNICIWYVHKKNFLLT